MLFRKVFFLFFIVCFFYSDLSSQSSSAFTRVLDLKLDNETARPDYFGSVFQYCEDTELLAYWNKITRSIKYFDLESGETVKETKVFSQGPNAVSGEPFYFHYHNKDSIFVFSEFQNSRLFLINDKSELVDVFDYTSEDGFRYTPIPRLTRVAGAIVVHKEYIYLAFQIAEQEERNKVAPILKYNMVTRDFDFLKFPRAYQYLDLDRIPKRGQYEFYESRIAFDIDKARLIVNYPLDQNLYSINSESRRLSTIETKKERVQEFQLLSKNKNSYNRKDVGYRKIIFGSPRYFGLFYSQYEQSFYRLVKLDNIEKWESKLSSGISAGVFKDYSIIKLDSYFNEVSEATLNIREIYPEKGLFISPEGLWSLLPDTKGEDIMSIGLLKLSGKQ